MEVLKVENLTYNFPDEEEPLLDEINFALEKGEFVLLSGESGTGKSILLSCLNGVIPHIWQGNLQGNIIFYGKNSYQMSFQEITEIAGTVLQDVEAQIFHLQVEDELVFGLENLGLTEEDIKKRLDKILPLVNLEAQANVQFLSGGQKQRLILGAVLAMLPKIILLDEPLANLDLESAHYFLAFLSELSKQGKTIVMIEHRLDLAAQYVDRLLYLADGKIKIDCKEKNIIREKEKEKRNSILVDRENNSCPDVPVLKIKNLSFAYSGKEILHNVNLEIMQGEKIIVLGENGCGKSTLLKILAGVNKKFLADEFQVTNQKIGFVLQNPNHQLFMQTVEQEVSLNAPDHASAEEFLILFGLHNLKERHPLTLSQGQKRLLALAAIAVSNPSLLLLDEPTIGQDYKSLGKIIEALNWLNREKGTTIITVTHDQKAAECLADKVIVLSGGTVQKTGQKELIHQYFTNWRGR